MHTVRFRDPTGLTRTGQLVDDVIETAGRTYSFGEVTILPPCEPTKIICQAGGFLDHRKESGVQEIPDRPELFLKTPNCVIGHKDMIELPPNREQIEFEGEFGIVIDQQCRAVTTENAMGVVRGFTCLNDISNRDDQEQERNWVRGKAFDASLPTGPVLATPDEVPDDARLTLRVNGETKQQTTREQMYFSVPKLVSEVSELITLEPGDIIASGTPFGPGPLSDGDTVEVEFEGVGTLRNSVDSY
ncbi:2-keto-4-pentenoate hydratase/2-oxohepta-3-ene-1,7-dioic acid hydratase (catechol pathway) (plasmid) [Halalkaliarchaeum sp. AArc-CO]|uniref:fumarylacetoacetate hydrolase family protein n=1 Tax=Halalkaliarchaeum sp. AArc-CO TaxID=2866381 RepID=UPI00217D9A78|nr:fumarylacetoacetate hydrolase family protein [Halalkaliarchaeum sp. AArc-CO]UWG49299.1 2-keto-4-pentenoate hydratase/2-oxohepta-3-ene-1,7-dioic acid hydratase (catechol pathway) [Halalkaliarchaeum sp. AArc-CO]